MSEQDNKISIQDLQSRLEHMMAILDKFLKENDINYFMWAGTMLGAVRHKGFIPWDDDLDIGMLRNDFERLLSISDKLPKPYRLRCQGVKCTPENYPYLFAKFEDGNTLLIEERIEHLGIESGVYIDIFVFDGVPKSRIIMKIHTTRFMFWMKIRKLLLMDPEKERTSLKQFFVKMTHRFFSLSKVINKASKISRKYLPEESEYITNYSGVYDKMNVLIKKKDIIDGPEYKFGEYSFTGISKPDIVLRQVYGDYMKLPPEEKRIGCHEYRVSFLNCDSKGEE